MSRAVLTCARAALDRATDEVLTNHASESGRWLRFNALLELAEDFNDFPADASDETSGALAADAAAPLPAQHVGSEAPAAPTAGASSEAA